MTTATKRTSNDPPDHFWTREEYDRLTDLGILDGKRVELIEGRIIQMAPQRVPHSVCIELVDRYLRRAFPNDHRIRIQLPFLSADGSEPEPDFAVVAGSDPRSSNEHPSSAVLIIEVSDTTLAHDRYKARLYAASGVAEYWILNLVDRTLEVHRDPLHADGSSSGPVYDKIHTLTEQQRFAPQGAPYIETTVAELLP